MTARKKGAAVNVVKLKIKFLRVLLLAHLYAISGFAQEKTGSLFQFNKRYEYTVKNVSSPFLFIPLTYDQEKKQVILTTAFGVLPLNLADDMHLDGGYFDIQLKHVINQGPCDGLFDPRGSYCFFGQEKNLFIAGKNAEVINLWQWTSRGYQCVKTFDIRLHESVNNSISPVIKRNKWYFVIQSREKNILLIDEERTDVIKLGSKRKNNVTFFKFIAARKTLLIGFEDGTIEGWHIEHFRHLYTLQGHTAAITQFACSSKSDFCASAAKDQVIRVWNLLTGKCVRVLKKMTGSVRHMLWIDETPFIITGSAQGALELWNVVTGTCCASYNVDGAIDGIIMTAANTLLIVLHDMPHPMVPLVMKLMVLRLEKYVE